MSQTVHHEVIEFLAQLDFLVQSPNFPKWSLKDRNSDEHITKLIKEICQSQHHRYTEEYVRDRLWQEFQPSYTYPESNFARLFLFGSCNMKTLDQDAKILLGKRVDEIRLQKSVLQKKRSLRSQSVLTESVPVPSRSYERTPTVASRPLKLNQKKKSTIPIQKRACVSKKTSLKIKRQSESKCRKHGREASFAASRDKVEQKLLSIPEDRKDVAPATPESEGISTQRPKPTIHDRVGHDLVHFEIHGKDRRSSKADTLAENYEATVSQIGQYKQRCQKLERERGNLTDELRRITSIFAQANGIDEGIVRQMRSQTRKIIDLKNQLEDRRHLETYLAIGSVHDDTPTTEKLHTDYRDMKDSIASILVLNGAVQVLVEPLYGQSDDLDILLYAIFQSCTEANAGNRPITAPKFTLREILQALIGAAVKVWIFENTFQSTSMMTTPLLQKYRQHIQTLCGHEGLYNLDVATHEALIQEKDFEEHVVAPMASRLTKRLLTVLRLVLWDQNADHAYDMIGKLAPRLTYIMSLGVHIRSLSLVSNNRIETIWPSAGVSFDESDMDSMVAGTGSLVKLPMLPGLIAYPKEKAVITYRGFADRGPKGGPPEYTIKAMVIV